VSIVLLNAVGGLLYAYLAAFIELKNLESELYLTDAILSVVFLLDLALSLCDAYVFRKNQLAKSMDDDVGDEQWMLQLRLFFEHRDRLLFDCLTISPLYLLTKPSSWMGRALVFLKSARILIVPTLSSRLPMNKPLQSRLRAGTGELYQGLAELARVLLIFLAVAYFVGLFWFYLCDVTKSENSFTDSLSQDTLPTVTAVMFYLTGLLSTIGVAALYP